MKTYKDIKEEVKSDSEGNLHIEGASLRCNYLKEIASITQRNVISYYSSFLQDPKGVTSEIEDEDLVGFINAIGEMDTSVGLDLILNTPGGSVEAAEAIIKYLHTKFNDIRVIIPQAALSAGTLIAASANAIIMGEGASLGPTDPEFFSGIPASDILKEFKEAKKALKEDPESEEYYKMRLKGLPIGFKEYVKDSINIVKSDLREWLSSYMFSELNEGKEKSKTVSKIVNTLVDNKKSHSYHFLREECESMGLKIIKMEDVENGKLLKNVIELHYLYILSFEDGKPGKLIEAYNDSSYFIPAKNK